MKLHQLIGKSEELDEVSELVWSSDPLSVYEDYDQYKLLVVRRIELQAGDETLNFRPETFVIKKDEVFYLDRESGDFSKLRNGFDSLYHQLEGYYRGNQKILTGYSAQIEKLEDFLFERNVPSFFMDIWFDVKKDLSRLENFYYRNGVVYHEFVRKTHAWFGDWSDEFKDIEESIGFQASSIVSLKSRLDGVHHYFDSIKHDRLNRTLLTLTLISGIFLPLNLIVGFWGMNTPGLPFMQDPLGSEKVALIIGGVVVFLLMGFQIVRVLDRYILRFLIGRYDFYKSISARIDELSSRLRGK